jgi:SAM-dependent methyltransferase
MVMQRIPEPDLMDDPEQARAYAEADFAEPHNRFVELFGEVFPDDPVRGSVLDLGCGPCDITLRFALAYHDCTLLAVDGAESMLALGRQAVASAGLEKRIVLQNVFLPASDSIEGRYDYVISNSLLHHLKEPAVLWQAVKLHAGPGAAVFVMDLMRPATREQAEAMVQEYAGDEPEVLRHDFYNSLLAAYRPDEIATQLAAAGLSQLEIKVVSDRHLIVCGRL